MILSNDSVNDNNSIPLTIYDCVGIIYETKEIT